LKECGSALLDMPGRVHLPVQNAKHRHSLGRDAVIDDVLLNAVGAEARSDFVS
jgi:hypothetical protein